MPKRKSVTTVSSKPAFTTPPIPLPHFERAPAPPPAKNRASRRKVSQPIPNGVSTNPDENVNVLDAPEALRASPDASEADEYMNAEAAGMDTNKQVKTEVVDEESLEKPKKGQKKDKQRQRPGEADKKASEVKTEPAAKPKANNAGSELLDPEAEGDEEADEEEIQAALSRPPPVNSDYLPLPWKGRLGYACLNTYLRFSNPPVFSSRTCRIASILENRHPLQDPNAPPHPTKNRPDRGKPADVARGQAFVESLGKANAKDIVKMLRWNHKFGIKFLRLSSEMFPFASHQEYGYKLAPFVSEELAEAGRVAAELGHRLTTHPGQFTQLGSPRQQVIDNAIRDLDYQNEMLSLLKLPPQQNRDAIMVLHLGGVFGDKTATLDRFRENYSKLSQGVKDRLVLENDDVSWSVHDLLPLCEELNIPIVLDFHHHNIIFDADKIREGTKDIVDLFPRIIATWKRKNITPKMHYSEPTPSAITGRQRRKHNPRVATMPPCPPDMDLMIEAKDKEQAVFELMRTFKLPGYDTFNDILPHVRQDDNKSIKTSSKKNKTPKKKLKTAKDEDEDFDDDLDTKSSATQQFIPDEELGMGGPENRVYWPPGMEHWLRPQKKVVKPKEPKSEEIGNKAVKMTSAMKAAATKAAAKEAAAVNKENRNESQDGNEDEVAMTPATKKARAALDAKSKAAASTAPAAKKTPSKKATKTASGPTKKRKSAKSVPTPSTSDEDEDEDVDDEEEEEEEAEETEAPPRKRVRSKATAAPGGRGRRQSARAKKISYAEEENDEEEQEE